MPKKHSQDRDRRCRHARCRRPRLLRGPGQRARDHHRSLSSAQVAYSTSRSRTSRPDVTDQLAGRREGRGHRRPRRRPLPTLPRRRRAADAAAKKKAAAAPPRRRPRRRARRRRPRAGPRKRAQVKPAAAKSYANNLDGWIRESLDIMKKHKASRAPTTACTATSCASPRATRTRSTTGTSTPSTASRRRVCSRSSRRPSTRTTSPGTSKNIYDPVANITAAANYAADRYGSIDNVNSAY